MSASIEQDVDTYLIDTMHQYQPGQSEYYARLALEEALKAYREGNYGIGAVAVVATVDAVNEFPNHNAMITGVGIVDHAETRALIDIGLGKEATRQYPRDTNRWTAALPAGITVFGTLEPCPMCVCTLTNTGAKLSVSTVLDGHLMPGDGFQYSDGAASVIGEKGKFQPKVWKWLQSQTGLTFELLDTEDRKLVRLSQRIFVETRGVVDKKLASRGN